MERRMNDSIHWWEFDRLPGGRLGQHVWSAGQYAYYGSGFWRLPTRSGAPSADCCGYMIMLASVLRYSVRLRSNM